MKNLDPNSSIFSGILSRNKCFKTQKGHFVKDLRIIRSIDLKDMLLLDNESFAFSYQVDNGIPLLPWHGDEKDCELTYLTKYLITLKDCYDMRTVNRKHFKLHELALMECPEVVAFI